MEPFRGKASGKNELPHGAAGHAPGNCLVCQKDRIAELEAELANRATEPWKFHKRSAQEWAKESEDWRRGWLDLKRLYDGATIRAEKAEAEVERLRTREAGYCDVCGEPHPNLSGRKEASP